MPKLPYIAFWLAFLLVHLDLHLVRCAPLTRETCPVSPDILKCSSVTENECDSDQQCDALHPGMRLKCCNDICGFKCVPPIVLKVQVTPTKRPTPVNKITLAVPGACPVFPEAAECPPEPDDECRDDAKCAEIHPGLGLKCCKDGCDFRCVPPISPETKHKMKVTKQTTMSPTTVKKVPLVVPGTCPVFPQAVECPPEPDDECNDDARCAELHPGIELKCCVDACDFRCVPPISPETKHKMKVTKPTTMSPTTVKQVPLVVPGTCPVFPEAAECPPDPDDECLDDAGCAELHPGLGLKCCKDGCDFTCVPPISPETKPQVKVPFVAPGTQPTIQPTTQPPTQPTPIVCFFEFYCSSDLDCQRSMPWGGYRCCDFECKTFRDCPLTTVYTTHSPTTWQPTTKKV